MQSQDTIKKLRQSISELPVGYISKKNINGKTCYYRQWKESGKIKSKYIPAGEVDYIAKLIDERKNLELLLEIELLRAENTPQASRRIYQYIRRLHLSRPAPVGVQYYEDLIQRKLFYIDKTNFISDWWNSGSFATLITRPRRFGKTLNISMINAFFSMKFRKRSDLFEDFLIWQNEEMRALQGTYPVIFISFGGIKESTSDGQLYSLKTLIHSAFATYDFLSDRFNSGDLAVYNAYRNTIDITDEMAVNGIYALSEILHNATGKKCIILIDEYDTPMLEAWMGNEWDKCAHTMRLFLNKTLKTNPYVERALLTGITRISKESFFSDLNHLHVCSMTSSEYDYAFGFTEEEVFEAMKEQRLSNYDEVKAWYNGFSIGSHKEIYNPWSIVNFLKSRKVLPYWVNSSSNALINDIFKAGDVPYKNALEDLINGKPIITNLSEEITFSDIRTDSSALWSLLFASGYLKIISTDNDNTCELSITNKEVYEMFIGFIRTWFGESKGNNYNEFIQSMLNDDIDYMQEYLERTIRDTFSYFDVSGEEPERFYHGFVLGMIITLRDRFIIRSNRESGLGRFDVILEPIDHNSHHSIILEFKIHRPRKENSIVDTALAALQQIENKQYASELISRGIEQHNIYKYGIAFKGKEIWIEGGH